MSTLVKNPIVYTFAAIGATLLVLSIFLGLRFSEALQLIFVPYTYDISHGVGAAGSKIYAMTLIVVQFMLAALTLLGIRLENIVARRFVWVIGVLLAMVYFVAMALGYLINNFH